MFESHDTPVRDDHGSDLEPPWWLDALGPDEPWTDGDALRHAVVGAVGVGHLAELMQIDPAGLSASQALSFAQEVERFVAFAAGFQAKARASVVTRLMDEAGDATAFVTPEMLVSAELSTALRVSPRSMDAQLDLVADLAGPMAPLHEALIAGRISSGHVVAIARELGRAPIAADARQVDEYAALCDRILTIVVPYAEGHTAGASARRTRQLVVAAVPIDAAERRRESEEFHHGVWLSATESGSCELTAVMPIAHGQAVFDAITKLAQHESFATSEGCITAGQRRVAALTTLVLGDPKDDAGTGRAVADAKLKARITVVVPLTTLVDGGTQAGTIGGEPVSADVLLDVVAQAHPASTLRRLAIDTDGCVLDAGRTRYAVSDVQRHIVRLRDALCRFPGCTRSATLCEVDHARPWDDGGSTDLANLGALCKHHHQLKTHGGWRITLSTRAGSCTWRSPLGRVYEHRPLPLVPPPVATAPPRRPAVDEPPPF